jgi:glycosyltransferase domain-containing protein
MSDDLLQKLTIVIFSYNRHKYLKRTIKYWSNYQAKILVLDGSDVKLKDPCLNTKDIKYIYDPRGIYERLLSSINYIETEFMILGGDDEFYMPSALDSCIEFLSKNPNFSSCGGRAIGFRTNGKEIFGSEQYSKLKDICLDYNSASERINKHFHNYVPAHEYSVMRSSKWKLICKHVFKKEYSFFAAFELQIEFLVMVSGKSKIIPELMWMRNREVEEIRGDSPSSVGTRPITKWWYDKKFIKEKEDFLYTMKKACDEISTDQNFKFTEEIITKLFEVYINECLKERSFIRKFINKIISNKIKKLIKPIVVVLWDNIIISQCTNLLEKKYKSLKEEVNLLETQGVTVNHKNLNQIISTLQYSNNQNQK